MIDDPKIFRVLKRDPLNLAEVFDYISELVEDWEYNGKLEDYPPEEVAKIEKHIEDNCPNIKGWTLEEIGAELHKEYPDYKDNIPNDPNWPDDSIMITYEWLSHKAMLATGKIVAGYEKERNKGVK